MAPDGPPELASLMQTGEKLLEQHDYAAAERLFERATTVAPGAPLPWRRLAQCLIARDEMPLAAASLRKACRLDPHSAALHRALAALYARLNQTEEAVRAQQVACRLNPDCEISRRELLRLLIADRQFEAAAQCLRQLAPAGGLSAPLLVEYAGWLDGQDELERARQAYEQALQLDRHCSQALAGLGNVLRRQEQWREAEAVYRRIPVPADRRGRALWSLWLASVTPQTFDSLQEIDDCRARFQQTVDAIEPGSLTIDRTTVRGHLVPPPYMLQFHGRDNRPLRERFAALFDVRQTEDQQRQQDACTESDSRPRVGLVLPDVGAGVFLRCMHGLLEHFDAERMQLAVVCPKSTRRLLEPHVRNPRLEWCTLPEDFSRMVPAIAAARFDVLYHWEIGSGVQNYFLPFFNLAPVQCTGWGLPETTGIPQMGWYLTSRLVEAPGAEQRYGEQLWHSERLLTCQARQPQPEVPASREDFGIAWQQSLYVCAQHVRKLHPDFDEMLAAVLRQDPDGVCLLVQDRLGWAAERVARRLQRTIPDVCDRIRWLPRLTTDQYRRLIQSADVLLDTPHFGGGLTTFDAFSYGRPVVTLPGEFRRSRFATACYRQMGLDCGIASNVEEYATLAVSLGRNRELRETVSRAILERSELLFDDTAAVREFEQVFLALAATGCKPGTASSALAGPHSARTLRSAKPAEPDRTPTGQT